MVSNNYSNWAKVGIVALAVMTAGCAEHEVRKLHAMEPTGSDFSKALSAQYKDLSTHEIRDAFDDTNAEIFAFKGQDAAAGKGESVMPEDLAKWELPSSVVPEMTAQRERLVSALQCKGRTNSPMLSALAQRYFDEWVEEASERWQMNEIKDARLDYYESIRRVEEIICPLDHAPQFHVYFATGSDKLNQAAMKVMESAYSSAMDNCHCKVFLTGTTDRSGTRNMNLGLSERRAESVKKDMLGRGVPESRLVARGHGVVPGSALHQQKNRAVEILIH